MCIVVDLLTLTLKVTLNGSIFTQKLRDLKFIPIPLKIKGGGTLIIGQDQDRILGDFNRMESFAGYVFDLFMTQQVLGEDDTIGFTTCSNISTEIDSVFDMKNIKDDFIIWNYTEIMLIQDNDTCKFDGNQYVLFTEEREFIKSSKFCKTLSGNLPAPKDNKENNYLLEKFPMFSKICKKLSDCRFWLGYKYIKSLDQVQHYQTGDSPTFSNWLGPITTNDDETCTVAWIGNDINGIDGNWRNMPCFFAFYTMCYFEKNPTFNIRGLCKESIFDRRYTLYGYKNNKPVLYGEKNTMISWSEKNSTNLYKGTWIMEINGNPHIYGIMVMESPYDYPMGVRQWLFYGDRCNATGRTELIVTTCDMKHFTCGDGVCIKMEDRCNLVEDCEDQSDEFDCGVLLVPPGYDIRFSPPKPNLNSPIKVDINFTLYAIRGIEFGNNEIHLEFGYERRWYDSQVRLKNLKSQTSQNIINDLLNRIWFPRTDFYGENFCLSHVVSKYGLAWADKISQPIEDNGDLIRPGE